MVWSIAIEHRELSCISWPIFEVWPVYHIMCYVHSVGPDQQVFEAVGLSWETDSSPYDENNGPRLVGAKLNHVGNEAIGESFNLPPVLSNAFPANDEFVLYDEGDFRLRILTSGGFSPDGVRGVLPTDFETFFKIIGVYSH